MKVLDNIKSIRKNKGLSQEYVASKLDLHVINYGKIENNKTALTIERLYKIAEILEVSVMELLGEESDVIKENIKLRVENDSLKIANIYTEEDKNRVEMALVQWNELKNLRAYTNTLQYLDYIDQEIFKTDNGMYFPLSIGRPCILIKEFENFFFSVGKNNASSIIRKYIDLNKFETSDLVIAESKFSGRSVSEIIAGLRKIQK